MAEQQLNWHRVAVSEAELPWNAEGLCVVEAGGKKITMANQSGVLFAMAHKCPHAGGLLVEGRINQQGCIVCPLHRYSFHLKTGFNTSGEGFFLKTYPIEQRVDGIYVGLKASGLFSF